MKGIIKTFRTDSQCSKILKHLQSGASLTCFEAMTMGLGMNLRSRVSNIRDAGHAIRSEQIKFNGGFVAKYTLIKEVL
jgi:AICAR transformylase/IMP cyclohydrolase PurH